MQAAKRMNADALTQGAAADFIGPPSTGRYEFSMLRGGIYYEETPSGPDGRKLLSNLDCSLSIELEKIQNGLRLFAEDFNSHR
jgi:hypothetical protein